MEEFESVEQEMTIAPPARLRCNGEISDRLNWGRNRDSGTPFAVG